MADRLSIMNRALSFLGERPITDPDSPDTSAGKILANIFDDSRKEVLRRYPWNFAETWIELDKTTAPPFGYDDAYAVPGDFIRLIWVGEVTQTRRDYRIINQGAPDYRKVIAINNNGENKLRIAYSADITLFNLWDPLAIKVLALSLALDISKGVTGQDNLATSINAMLTEELRDAVGVDGQEQVIRIRQESPVMLAREQAQTPEAIGWFNGVFTDVSFP